jgi:hypothetical protein
VGGSHPVSSTESGESVIPYSCKNEDEFPWYCRRIGARVGDRHLVVEEGGFLFQPPGVVHALCIRPTSVPEDPSARLPAGVPEVPLMHLFVWLAVSGLQSSEKHRSGRPAHSTA